MKRPLFAAICGSLLFVFSLQVLSLQAQNTPDFPDPGKVQAESLNAPAPRTQPLTPQPAAGQQEQEEKPSEFAKYPIWLLIKPQGIQFLQTQEEIATNQNAIPANAFLLGCVKVDFQGSAGEQKPDFRLECEDFLLLGRFGTQQNLDVKGASLNYSTESKQVQLGGSEALPLEFHSVDAASETRMQADEITLQLHSGPKTVTRYEERTVVKSGLQVKEYVPVTAQVDQGTSFQLSAKNITAMEIHARPAVGGDAPKWNPNPVGNNIPTYEDASGAGNNVPFYQPPTKDKLPTY